MQWIY